MSTTSTTITRWIFIFMCVTQTISSTSFLQSLIRHINIRHITFLKPDDDPNNLDYIQLQKSLPWLYVSVVSYSGMASMIEGTFTGISNSLVVIYDNQTTFNTSDLIQITRNGDISPFKWIVITSDYSPEDYSGLHIPYNCEFMVAVGSGDAGYDVIEIYDTLNVKKISNFLGKWSPAQGLRMTSVGLFQRRGNLQGTAFNISSNQKNPCSIQSFESSAGSVLMCIHFHIFNLLGEKNNFSINWIPQHSDAYESTYYPRYLTDSIHFTIFEVNTKQKEGTTVIWPTISSQVAVFTSYAGRAIGWTTYIYPFSNEMWLALFVWFTLSSAITAVADFLTLDFRKRNEKWKCVKIWFKYIFLSLSAFCSQNDYVESEWNSLRILLLLIFLIPTALMPGYSAALTSFLAVKVETAPFGNLEELSRAKDYKLGHIASFNLSNFLDRHSEDEVVRRLYRDIILPLNEMPIKEQDGIQRMCKEKFSYLCTTYAVVAVPPECSYYSLDRPLFRVLSMMPIKSNNPFKGLIRRSLKDMIFNGVFVEEARKIVPIALTNPNVEKDDMELEAIEFENVVAIIAVLGLGILLSILVLLLEILSFRPDYNRIALPN